MMKSKKLIKLMKLLRKKRLRIRENTTRSSEMRYSGLRKSTRISSKNLRRINSQIRRVF
nr:MAG TPA: hypothetical protein [Caudoviricetes sp.]